VILRDHVKPCSEVADLLLRHSGHQLLEDVHHLVLGLLSVLQVFQAYAEDEVHVSLIQLPQDPDVTLFAVTRQEFLVAPRFKFSSQEYRPHSNPFSAIVNYSINLRKS